ncbi:hypothetical protein Tco_0868750 [Tanacetum coccineum]
MVEPSNTPGCEPINKRTQWVAVVEVGDGRGYELVGRDDDDDGAGVYDGLVMVAHVGDGGVSEISSDVERVMDIALSLLAPQTVRDCKDLQWQKVNN